MARSPTTNSAITASGTTIEVPAGAPPWITPELLAQTLATWQPYYAAPLTLEDAVEILLSAGQLIEALEGGHVAAALGTDIERKAVANGK